MSNNSYSNTAIIEASLKKRYAREKRFRWYGRLAVLTGFVFLFLLLADIVTKGTPAFTQSCNKVYSTLDPDKLGIGSKPTANELWKADYNAVIKSSLRAMFPDVKGRKQKKQLYRLISVGAEYIYIYVVERNFLIPISNKSSSYHIMMI